ncbi:zinc finger protein Xfin-like isoform X2 [Chelonus insularis]|uniref:zinc finger protein Xfin-like isoform X2 n=1 Tax=Chelonus insularis TaxID=460826 RepID=UPI00158D7B34|nr:zinc finger protein Xfin-like isoform X2 [Chelonus insularis]
MINSSKINSNQVPNSKTLNKNQSQINLKHKNKDNSSSNETNIDNHNKMNIKDETIEISDSDSESIKCIVCNEQFYEKLHLREHLISSHPELPDLIVCDLCNESFLNEDELRDHVSNDHDNNVNSKKDILQQISSHSKVIRTSQRKIARRKWMREQLESSKDNGNSTNSHNESVIDSEKNNLQYPTSTVEIEESSEHVDFLDQNHDESNSSSKSQKHSNDNYNNCDNNSELLQETVADSSVSNQSAFNEFQELTTENSSLASTKENSEAELTTEFISIGDGNVDKIIIDDDSFEYNVENNPSVKNDNCNEITNNSNKGSSDIISTTCYAMSNSNHELAKKITNNEGKMPKISTPNKSTMCRTYLDKFATPIVQKPTTTNVKSNEVRSAVYCYMCNEIFCLMDQKCMKVTEGDKELIKCLFCNRKFAMKTTLEKHVAYSHLNCECIKNLKPVKTFSTTDQNFDQGNGVVNSNYECSICHKTFLYYSRFNYHVLNAHEITSTFKERLTIGKPEYLRRLSTTNFLCKASNNEESAPLKSTTKNRNTPIRCMSCELVFNSCKDYVDHIKKTHKDVKPIEESSWYPFPEPNPEVLTSSLRLLQNLRGKSFISENNTEKNFHELRKTCKRCNREFDSIRELSKHFYLVHEDPSDSQPPRTSTPTPTTSTVTTLTTTVSGERRTHDWFCLHCSQRFKMLQSYIRHRYFVHDDESMVHICENCCKILTSLEMVNLHVCSNVTSWTCKQCNESFPSSIALRLHNTEKHYELPGPHICPTCEKKFLTKTMLLRHVQNKNCYPHICPPEPSDIAVENSTVNIDSLKITKNASNYSKLAESKQSKEITSIKNFTNIEVLQEDVLLRKSTLEEGKEESEDEDISKYLKFHTKEKKSEDDKIYQCSMCKLYFLSKSGLKLHINRAHTSAVEICQLCYRMYDTGNLVRHIIDQHLKTNKTNEPKGVNNSETKENDIEKDTEELIKLLGTKHLLALCEYQRHLELNFNLIACPRCSSAFETSEQYRLHNANVHDKLCALCDAHFNTGSEAANHKSTVHGSIPCYVWFAHKIILAIGDTKTFEETAEKIIVENMTGNNGDENDEQLEEESLPLESEDACNEDAVTSIEDQNTQDQNQEQKMILTVDPDVSVDPSDEDDELRLFLVVTEQDLEKYKNNLTQLATQISSACNIFSTEDIEKLLQLYVKND